MTELEPKTVELQKILVVDDEPRIRSLLVDTLEMDGYKVSAATNGIEALALMEKEVFAVILSDYKMPKMTGLEFLGKAKLIQPHTSRILATGVPDLTMVIEAINKGEIYRFLVKPWLPEELIVTIKNALQRYELICSNETLQTATLKMNEQLTQLNLSLEQRVVREAEQNVLLEHLNRALAQNLEHSVELCQRVAQTFYPTLGSHARRVAAISKAMSETLKLPADLWQILEISSWLYDVGLVGVPRQLIRRWQESPQLLSQPEWQLIKHHPVLGQELASFVHHLKAVGNTIRVHHERFDGTGYPDRLKGQDIPWLGHLLIVAVGYVDAGFHVKDAEGYVLSNSGTAFDPEAVRVLMRSLPQAVLPRVEKELLLSELRPGMILASGIYNSQGLLLMPEGSQLNETAINRLEAHDMVSPIRHALHVFV